MRILFSTVPEALEGTHHDFGRISHRASRTSATGLREPQPPGKVLQAGGEQKPGFAQPLKAPENIIPL
jgi:hypothetical protein